MKRKFLLLMLFGLAGCSGRIEKAQLPGTYEFSLDSVRQVIVIGSNGRYSNTLYEDGMVAWADKQEWTYEDEQDGKQGVTFTRFRFGIPGHSASPGYWFVIPEKTLGGGKELCFDLDLGRCFQSR